MDRQAKSGSQAVVSSKQASSSSKASPSSASPPRRSSAVASSLSSDPVNSDNQSIKGQHRRVSKRTLVHQANLDEEHHSTFSEDISEEGESIARRTSTSRAASARARSSIYEQSTSSRKRPNKRARRQQSLSPLEKQQDTSVSEIETRSAKRRRETTALQEAQTPLRRTSARNNSKSAASSSSSRTRESRRRSTTETPLQNKRRRVESTSRIQESNSKMTRKGKGRQGDPVVNENLDLADSAEDESTAEKNPESKSKGVSTSSAMDVDESNAEEAERTVGVEGEKERAEREEGKDEDGEEDEEDYEDEEEGDGEQSKPASEETGGSGGRPSGISMNSGLGISALAYGMSGGSGMSSRFKEWLLQLKNGADPTLQLVALQDLAEFLSIATALGLGADLPPELMAELGLTNDLDGGMGMNPELMLLACRCLSNLIEALPSSTMLIVQNGGVNVLMSKLMEVEYIDLAEQVLSVLEKISVEYPGAVIRANGLLAVLQYIDFFSLHVQRTAVMIAANACRALGSQVLEMVKDAVPTLERLLLYSDQKLVEQTVRCLGTIVEWCYKTEDKLQLLVSQSLLKTIIGLVNPANVTGSSEGTSTGLANANSTTTLYVFSQLVKILTNAVRGSPQLGSLLVTELEIVGVIRGVLSDKIGVRLEVFKGEDEQKRQEELQRITMAVMNVVVNRPADQILEVLTLASEVLPALPKDSEVWNFRVPKEKKDGKGMKVDSEKEQKDRESRRLSLLRANPAQLGDYVTQLVPVLIEVFGATVNAAVRRKVVECKHEGAGSATTELSSSTSSEVPPPPGPEVHHRERREALLLLASGVQIAKVAMDKGGPGFKLWFVREGVIKEMERLVESLEEILEGGSAVSATSSKAESIDEKPGWRDWIDSADELLKKVDSELQTPSATDVGGSKDESEGVDETKDEGDAGSRKRRSNRVSAELKRLEEMRDGVLEELRRLGEKLGGSKGENDMELDYGDEIRETLRALQIVAQHFAGGGGGGASMGGVTGYEVLESGVLDGLMSYLTMPGANDIVDGNEKVKTASLSLNVRLRMFVHVFLNGPTPDPNYGNYYVSNAMRMLVQRLQESLSRVERFEIATAFPSTNSARRDGVKPSLQLGRQIKIKLVAEEPESVPRQYSTVLVSVHAVGTYRALEEYLKPRVSVTGASGSSATTSEPSSADGSAEGSSTTNAEAEAVSGVKEKSEDTKESEDEKVSAGPSFSAGEGVAATKGDIEGESKDAEKKEGNEDEDGSDEEDEEEGEGAENYEDEEDEEDEEEDDDFGGDEAESVVDVRPSTSESRPIAGPSDGNSPSAPVASGSSTSAMNGGERDAADHHEPPTVVSDSAPQASASTSTTRSYAQAAGTSVNSFSIQFSLGDQVIPREMTIFGSIYRHEQQRLREAAGSDTLPVTTVNVWSNVFTIKYKKIATSPASNKGSRSNTPRLTSSPGRQFVLDKDTYPGRIMYMLHLLHGINSRWTEIYVDEDALSINPLVPSAFQNNKLTAKLNRQLDEPLIVASHVLPSWCSIVAKDLSFLVPFETRLVYLQSTSFGYSRSMGRWQQQNAPQANAGSGRGGSGLLRGGDMGSIGRIQRQKVRISRSRIVDSMLKVMELYGSAQALLEVEFFDEVGTGLGPTLEFYAQVSKDVRRRKGVTKAARKEVDVDEFLGSYQGLFPSPMLRSVAEGESGKKTIDLFKCLGTFVAKALLDSRLVDLPFNPIFLEMVVGQEEEQEQTAENHIDKPLYTSLMDLKKYSQAKRAIEKDESLTGVQRHKAIEEVTMKGARLEDLCLDFTLPGFPDMELKPGGRDVNVTMGNVEEYVQLVVDATVGSGVRKQIEAFRKGFNRVFPVTDLRTFSVQELGVLVSGSEEEDWSVETLMDAMKPDHGYNQDSRPIKYLVEMMSTFQSVERREFLQFVTGSPKLPIGGFKALSPCLTVVCKNVEGGRKPDDYLPSVMTCVNYLKVPQYSDVDVMRRRFEVAMREGQGCFHLS
ncbi:hypothetical protein BJ742DRAFT_710021 [Cladochytrium replicatum]|nr:hypothetical protein BJ742DRAFT_710021 [Cladochytrium replicatum]